MQSIDYLDIAVTSIVCIALVGLIWAHPSVQLAETLTNVLWAGLVGLGLKKAPSTLGK